MIFYWGAISIVNFLYDKKIIKAKKIQGAKVISVGNITTGGTGKTPFSLKLVQKLREKNKNEKIAIILRGYGGKLNNKNINIIKKDGRIYYNAKMAGDEAWMLAEKTDSNCFILTSKNKSKAAKFAFENFGCKTIVLDDSFQHRKIVRDFDFVLVDSEKQFGNGFVLPLGPLREPVSSLNRSSSIILVNKTKNLEEVLIMKNDLEKKYKKNIHICTMKQDSFVLLENRAKIIPAKDIYAFCAIGQPNQFYHYLKKDFNLKGTKTFNDHHRYSQKDADCISKKAIESKAKMLITTEKDAVKLKNLTFSLPICVLVLDCEFEFDNLELNKTI